MKIMLFDETPERSLFLRMTIEAVAPDAGCAGRFEVKVEDGVVFLQV